MEHSDGPIRAAPTIASQANREILDLWYRPQFNLKLRRPRMPLVYPELREGGIVIVSLNPSFSHKAFASMLSGEEWQGFDPVRFYAWRDTPSEFDVARAQEIERIALGSYSFFLPFADMAAQLHRAWQHIDLFAIRATRDNMALKWVGAMKRSASLLQSLNPFGRAQVEWCVGILERIRPEAIIIPNISAARILSERLDAQYDIEHGHYWLGLGANRVPAFMSSMWSGARALDRYTKELLKWHIQRSLERINLASKQRPTV